jgi:hypothetical protein
MHGNQNWHRYKIDMMPAPQDCGRRFNRSGSSQFGLPDFDIGPTKPRQ